MTNSIIPSETQTMSSREIAELTGKRHSDVLRDIRKMLETLETPERRFAFGYLDANNQERKEYQLPKDLTLTLVSGYNIPLRHKIIKRWEELETRQQQPFQTPFVPAQTLHDQAFSMVLGGVKVMEALGAPRHIAVVESSKHAERATGFETMSMLKALPCFDNIKEEEVMLEPTELAERLGLASGMSMNRQLAAMGLQAKINGQWTPTDEGEAFCVKHLWTKNGKTGYNLKWNVSKIESLLTN